tara:strand:- start:120 stop:281 length:162 start_codon:yes stop_codon:yes gene_type:complete
MLSLGCSIEEVSLTIKKAKSKSVDKTQVKNSKTHHLANQKFSLGVSNCADYFQ